MIHEFTQATVGIFFSKEHNKLPFFGHHCWPDQVPGSHLVHILLYLVLCVMLSTMCSSTFHHSFVSIWFSIWH